MKKKNNLKSIFQALLAVTCFLILCISCAKSPEKKTAILLKEYAKANIADYESFEVMELDSVKEKFSDLYDEQILVEYLNMSLAYKDSIKNADSQIREIYDYICECQYMLKRAKHVSAQAWANQWNTYTTSKNLFSWVAAEQASGAADDNVKELEQRISDAYSAQWTFVSMKERCIDSLYHLIINASDYIRDYKPKNLGQGTVAKCRFRGEDGNMRIVVYDVFLNDDITSITSINEQGVKTENNQVHEFVQLMLDQRQKFDADIDNGDDIDEYYCSGDWLE